MIQLSSVLNVADNSGAKRVRCIKVMGGSAPRFAGIGDLIKVSVIEASPEGAAKKGKTYNAVIARVKKETRRNNGAYVKFDDNAAVILDNQKEMIGTRVFGPVGRELRWKRFMKIVSLAPEVL